jgi:hypothetical protein
MEEDIIQLNVYIGSVSKDLIDVQKALEAYRKKQESKESPDKEAFAFVEKAEKVIQKAENGEIQLSPDQIQKIASNLLKIQAKINSLKNE